MADKNFINSDTPAASKSSWDYPVIGFMVVIHLMAILALFHFSWQNFALFLGMWFVTGCLGITLGFHRLLTHRSFRVPKWLERFFATCGALALQGSPLTWVGHHRMHHAGSDTSTDPHDSTRGFWFSHFGWMLLQREEFDDTKILRRYARDITADPYYRWLESTGVLLSLQIMLGIGLYFVGGLSAVGWGVFLRLVVGYHLTWFVNSASHIWGFQRYKSNDSSRNNWWVALLTFGEGWHNNHHTFGTTARAGHKWWEIDLTYYIIFTLKLLGLAKNIRGIPENAHEFLVNKPKVIRADELASDTASTVAIRGQTL